MSSKAEIDMLKSLCHEDTVRMRNDIVMRVDRWGFFITCLNGSQRGKRMSRLQVTISIPLFSHPSYIPNLTTLTFD